MLFVELQDEYIHLKDDIVCVTKLSPNILEQNDIDITRKYIKIIVKYIQKFMDTHDLYSQTVNDLKSNKYLSQYGDVTNINEGMLVQFASEQNQKVNQILLSLAKKFKLTNKDIVPASSQAELLDCLIDVCDRFKEKVTSDKKYFESFEEMIARVDCDFVEESKKVKAKMEYDLKYDPKAKLQQKLLEDKIRDYEKKHKTVNDKYYQLLDDLRGCLKK